MHRPCGIVGGCGVSRAVEMHLPQAARKALAECDRLKAELRARAAYADAA